jgi:hypothetical protein
MLKTTKDSFSLVYSFFTVVIKLVFKIEFELIKGSISKTSDYKHYRRFRTLKTLRIKAYIYTILS